MRRIPYVWLLIFPLVSYAVGFSMNEITVAANGGQMPVLRANCDDETMLSPVHKCMTPETRLKPLCDWILLRGVGTFSPGDFLIELFDVLFWPLLVVWGVLMVRDHWELSKWAIT